MKFILLFAISTLLTGCAILPREEILDKGPFFKLTTTTEKDQYIACVSENLYDNLKWSIFNSPFIQMRKSIRDDLTEISLAGGQPLVADIFIIQFHSYADQLNGMAFAQPYGFINQRDQELVIKKVMESCDRQ